MGWNCSITVIPGATLDDLRSAGAAISAERVAGDDATASGFLGVAAGERDGTVVLLAAGPIDRVDELAAQLGRDAFDTVFSSVGDTYVWRVVGATGLRMLVSSAGEVVADTGTPHAAETGLTTLDEDGLFTLLERATGFTPVFDDLPEGGFHRVELPGAPSSAPAPEAPSGKPRWFRRR